MPASTAQPMRRVSNERRNHHVASAHGAAGLDDVVAHPDHAPGVFDRILVRKTEVAREIGAHRVGVEDHGVQERCEHVGKRRLAGAGQAMIKILRWFTSAPLSNWPC